MTNDQGDVRQVVERLALDIVRAAEGGAASEQEAVTIIVGLIERSTLVSDVERLKAQFVTHLVQCPQAQAAAIHALRRIADWPNAAMVPAIGCHHTLREIAREAIAAAHPAPSAPHEATESPILAFQAWAEQRTKASGPLTQDEYFLAQEAFFAAHPGQGPTSKALALVIRLAHGQWRRLPPLPRSRDDV